MAKLLLLYFSYPSPLLDCPLCPPPLQTRAYTFLKILFSHHLLQEAQPHLPPSVQLLGRAALTVCPWPSHHLVLPGLSHSLSFYRCQPCRCNQIVFLLRAWERISYLPVALKASTGNTGQIARSSLMMLTNWLSFWDSTEVNSKLPAPEVQGQDPYRAACNWTPVSTKPGDKVRRW